MPPFFVLLLLERKDLLKKRRGRKKGEAEERAPFPPPPQPQLGQGRGRGRENFPPKVPSKNLGLDHTFLLKKREISCCSLRAIRGTLFGESPSFSSFFRQTDEGQKTSTNEKGGGRPRPSLNLSLTLFSTIFLSLVLLKAHTGCLNRSSSLNRRRRRGGKK